MKRVRDVWLSGCRRCVLPFGDGNSFGPEPVTRVRELGHPEWCNDVGQNAAFLAPKCGIGCGFMKRVALGTEEVALLDEQYRATSSIPVSFACALELLGPTILLPTLFESFHLASPCKGPLLHRCYVPDTPYVRR